MFEIKMLIIKIFEKEKQYLINKYSTKLYFYDYITQFNNKYLKRRCLNLFIFDINIFIICNSLF